MRFNRKPPKPKKGAPAWTVTFSDLITLILVFFILLFSMSQIDMMKFKTVAESFKSRQILDFNPSVIPLEDPPQSQEDENKLQDDGKDELELMNLLGEVEAFLRENGLEDVIIANRTERGVVLVLDEQVLFRTGEAEIISGSSAFLDKVGSMLERMPNLVKVEGHTDNRPITTFKYPSNWELSTARSSSVIRYFIQNFDMDSARFMAIGYGETRPIVPNNSPENWNKNRRVEIVISDPKYVEKNND